MVSNPSVTGRLLWSGTVLASGASESGEILAGNYDHFVAVLLLSDNVRLALRIKNHDFRVARRRQSPGSTLR